MARMKWEAARKRDLLKRPKSPGRFYKRPRISRKRKKKTGVGVGAARAASIAKARTEIDREELNEILARLKPRELEEFSKALTADPKVTVSSISEPGAGGQVEVTLSGISPELIRRVLQRMKKLA